MIKTLLQRLPLFGILAALMLPGQLAAQCPTPPGNQTAYGVNQWIGYVYTDANLYATAPASVTAGTYHGYVTRTESFDQALGAGAISGANLCGTYTENFGVKYFMQKNFAAGYYNITVGADDGYRLSLDGGVTWLSDLSDWALHSYQFKTATYYLSGNTNLVLEYFERTGDSRILFNYAAVTCPSTAPTAITGATVATCSTGTTLTATGGTGSTYQWGTGSVIGQNIIANQTASTISVAPTVNTTYWVRRVHAAPCSGYTPGITVQVTMGANPGDPAVFGSNQWNAYAYSGSNISLTGLTYLGYYTQATLGFDTMSGTNSWPQTTSPSSAAGYQGCTVPVDNHTIVYKRKGFPCGRYTLTMQRWDDEAILYVDGVQVWYQANWSGAAAVNDVVGSFNLNENSTIEFRVREIGGDSNGVLLINAIGASTAPTSITGTATICLGASTTLTAAGGVLGANAVYEWGTGTPGSNIIANQSGAIINVSPTINTTYWVRIKNTYCQTTSASASINVVVHNTVPGTLSTTAATICLNSLPGNITLSGYSGSIIKWQSATNAAFTQNVTDIANTTPILTGAQAGLLNAPRYFRAVVQAGTCSTIATTPLLISVGSTVTWNNSWSGVPSSTSTAVIESSLTLPANLTICACEVKNTAVLTVPAGVVLTVVGKVTVLPTAALVVENNGALIQTENVANTGNITLHRNSSKIKRLDYTLWSSPVAGQQLLAFSPLTLTNRFYGYNTLSNQYTSLPATSDFETAKGYLIRTPNNHPVAATVQAGTFTGVPNNGSISRPLVYGSSSLSYNAVGNPYPSPISVAAFIDANITNIQGTLWFWRKTNDSNENRSYSTVTKFGYTANTAAGGENDYAIDPNGIINTGQAFIVKASAAGQAVFNNNMRVGGSTNQFFRTTEDNSYSRIWLNVSTAGAFSQTMFGYTADATYGYDNGFDGLAIIDGSLNIYSFAGDVQLAIQARPEFTTADAVPLGFKTNTPGSFEFSIDHVDGLFLNGQAIYIKDNLLNLTHNLKLSSYAFTSEAGTFDTRFEVVYVPMEVMGTNPVAADSSTLIYPDGKHVKVTSTRNIRAVVVYDLLGRLVYSSNTIEKDEFVTPELTAAQQVLIVKVKLDNDTEAIKKVLMK